MVDSALRSSKRMSRLVADLLLLARADAGRAGAHRDCDLAEIAGNVAAELAPLLGDRELEIDNEGALPLHEAKGEALVEVADDGPGGPPNLRDQIFGRFVRGEGPADTAVGQGSGLGLAIVRAVPVSPGGSVEVGASESDGALFRVHLPLQRSERPVSTF